jgi:hypothetical protein
MTVAPISGGLRLRPRLIVATLVLSAAAPLGAVAASAPAGAAVPPVTGSVRCAISNPVMTFTPGLRYKDHITGIQKGRGRSSGTLTAGLSGCTDPSSGPAPGGIDHGSLHGLTHVGGSYCNLSEGIKLRRVAIEWFRFDNTLIGTTRVKLAVSVQPFDFYSPGTATFGGTTKANAKVLPSGALTMQLPTTKPSWAIQVDCFKFELSTLGLVDGTFALDGPP